MTIAQMKDYFLILQDKFGSPYYTDSEIEDFINRGTIDEIVALLPKDGQGVNVELNQNTVMRVAPLLFTVTGFHPANATGAVPKADIDTAVGYPVMRILAVGWNDENQVKYTRRNNWFVYKANAFKRPTLTQPRLYEGAAEWTIAPADTSAAITFMGIRYPVAVNIAGNVDSEMPDMMHNEIIARALSLAGVGSRDQMLSELKQLNGV